MVTEKKLEIVLAAVVVRQDVTAVPREKQATELGYPQADKWSGASSPSSL
jgi:hypothetical protein